MISILQHQSSHRCISADMWKPDIVIELSGNDFEVLGGCTFVELIFVTCTHV